MPSLLVYGRPAASKYITHIHIYARQILTEFTQRNLSRFIILVCCPRTRRSKNQFTWFHTARQQLLCSSSIIELMVSDNCLHADLSIFMINFVIKGFYSSRRNVNAGQTKSLHKPSCDLDGFSKLLAFPHSSVLLLYLPHLNLRNNALLFGSYHQMWTRSWYDHCYY